MTNHEPKPTAAELDAVDPTGQTCIIRGWAVRRFGPKHLYRDRAYCSKPWPLDDLYQRIRGERGWGNWSAVTGRIEQAD